MVDTGGLLGFQEDCDLVTQHVRAQALTAVQEASVILFVFDAKEGITGVDRVISTFLRTKYPDKKVIAVVNKLDNMLERLDNEILDPYHRLGFGKAIPLSAMSNSGLTEILDRVIEGWDPSPSEVNSSQRIRSDQRAKDKDNKLAPRQPESVRVAIVGQPNVGKSSLLNCILRENRAIVSEIPGTYMNG